jgi:alpha-glucosidase
MSGTKFPLLGSLKNLTSGFVILFIVFLGSCAPFGDLRWTSDTSLDVWELREGIRAERGAETIRIISRSGNREFLRFPTKHAFLSAGEGNPSVGYRMAAFTFQDELSRKCTDQSIQSITEKSGNLHITGSVFGKDCDSKYQIVISPKNSKEVDLSIRFQDSKLNRIWVTIGSEPDEGIFGLGEQFSIWNWKGEKPFLFTEEQGIGRGDQPITAGANIMAGAGGNKYTTYAPIPHYITTENRSLFIENSGYSKFEFEKSITRIEFWDFQLEGGFQATFWIGEDPIGLIEDYTKKTGRMPQMPDWAYGTILGLQGGTKKVTEVVDQAKKAGNPVTGLWIQDWCGRRVTNFGDQLAWRWYADENLYPNFKEFVKSMNQKGVQVLGYVNPFLADTDPKKPGGDDFRNPMLDEARKKGYLVKNTKGEPYLIQTVGFPAYLIDLTNPAAVKWTKEIIKKNMIGVGLSGWMADFGEWLPYDAVMHSGVSARVYHNQYPVDWAKLNREAIREAGAEGKIVFFTRAGYSYSNKYSTLFWLGDQMVSFQTHDGLPSAVLGMLTSGVSGISLNHSDIGGYTTITNPIANYHRSKELFLRWAELSAFSPVFRTHEGNRPLANWQGYEYSSPERGTTRSDRETVETFAKMGRLHFALKDYLKEMSKQAAQTGIPIVRHLYLHYPSDPEVRELKYQYLLGRDLLVLPVIREKQSSVRGYLPEGQWKHIWTGKVYSGKSWVEVDAPIGQPAGFVLVGGKYSKLLDPLFGIR